ncbi:hypothetical protein FNAPI_7384 [Fusarium napiforme]|uniref:Uncharacterized protein n=1 Tax=Fusarium napiforme TaxID=42672 RepID=A0A8H5JCN4_9HYPO|nr:hypothetical protein FNAPI_7384 [Fusarium napiforme]
MGSDTSSTNSESSELHGNSSTCSGNGTDSGTVQAYFDHGQLEDDELSSYARELHTLHALYIESLRRTPLMDVKRRDSSLDSICAVWGSPKRHSELFLEFESSHESEEASETRSSRFPSASGRYTAQSSTRSPNLGCD